MNKIEFQVLCVKILKNVCYKKFQLIHLLYIFSTCLQHKHFTFFENNNANTIIKECVERILTLL